MKDLNKRAKHSETKEEKWQGFKKSQSKNKKYRKPKIVTIFQKRNWSCKKHIGKTNHY